MRKLYLFMILVLSILTGHSMAHAAPTLAIITSQPTGEMQNLTQIVVRFSENMRPLGEMEQAASTSPMQLTVEKGSLPKGQFRWLDPATLAYLFDEPIDVPVNITATVPAGTQALSGNTLPKSVSWRMNTPPLTLSLSASSNLPQKNAQINLFSNYPIDLASLKAKTKLLMNGKPLPIDITEPDTSAHKSYGRQVRWYYPIKIQTDLPADQKLTLNLSPGIPLKKGDQFAGAYSFPLASYQTLRVDSWNAGSQKKGQPMPPEENVTLGLNNPVSLSEILSHLDISPKAAPIRQNEDENDSARKDNVSSWQSLPFRWEARTRYTVTLKPGVKDIYGTTLPKASTFSFTTGDFYPLINMDSGNKVMESPLKGIYPMDIRNMTPVKIRVRHLPWDKASYNGWWQNSQYNNSLAEVPALAEKTENLDLSADFNKNIRYELDLPKILGYGSLEAMPQGLTEIFVTVIDPNNRDSKGKAHEQVLYATTQITNIGINAKMGVNEGLAWITDITTGKPLANVALTLINAKGEASWQGTTDEKGIARLPGRQSLPAETRYLVARLGNDISVLNTNGNFGNTGYSNNYDSFARNNYWQTHAITQLPLYQPGQTVNYTLYAKNFTEKEGQHMLEVFDWRPVAGEKVQITVKDSRYRDVHTQEATTNRYGSVSGSFTLSDEAALGQYQFFVTRAGSNHTTSTQGFQVAVFRAPDFKVDIDAFPDQPNPPARARPISIGVKAAYFSGVALPGASALMKVTRKNESFTPARLDGYKTGSNEDHPFMQYRSIEYHGRYYDQPGQLVAELTGTTNAKGMTRFSLPDIVAEPGQPLRVGMETTVTDASGLTTQGASNFLLHPSASYIGIRAPRIMLSGKAHRISLKGATWDDKPLSNADIRLRLERVRGNRQRSDEPATDLVWEKKVPLTSANGIEIPINIDKSGTYYLIASITDDMGRENRSLTTLFVPGNDMDWLSSRSGNSIELLAEDIEYKPGDTARIIIRNPYYDPAAKAGEAGPHQALVTLERESVKSHFFIDINDATYPLDIKLSEADAPYLFVSVVMVKGRTAPPPAIGDADNRDMGAPWARQGTSLIRIKKTVPELLVNIDTGKTQYRPGETVDAKIQVSDTDKRTRQAQVTLLAVDNRILRAAGEKTRYDPGSTFAPIQVYGINSGDSRAELLNLSQLSPRQLGGLERKMGAPMAAEMAMSGMRAKDAASDNSTDPLRQNFSPLAYWLAEGETDASGILKTRFTLPDTLTSYRIVAIVADKTRDFAVKEAEITASKPLQLLSAMPRFATEGDKLDARILVQNASSRQQNITVTAKASNMQLDTASQSITLGAGQSGTVTFPANILAPGMASLEVSGKMGKESDTAAFSFPVMPAAPLTTVAAAGLLKQGETHSLPVKPPYPLDPRSKLAVIFAASPAAGLPLTAEQLITYPWGCLEQRMSRAWVRAIRLQHGDLIGLKADKDDRQIIQATLNDAEKFQKQDGGFALWTGVRESSFYLTVYVLTVNNQTRALGITLPENVERMAYNYIRSRMLQNESNDKTQTDSSLDAEAMALMLMAKQNPAEAQRLYPKVLARTGDGKNVNPMTWGGLLMTANALPQMPEKAQYQSDIIRRMEKTAQITPTHLHFASNNQGNYWMSMGSTLRDNGMVLAALTQTRPDYPRLEALAAWTSQSLGDKKTLSTQEAIYGLWGLTSYLKNLGGNQPVSLKATWNNSESMTKRFTKLIDPPQTWVLPADKLPGGQSTGLTFQAIEGNPYWTARLTYASPSIPLREENAGFTVRRSWAKEGQKPGESNAWKMGDIINVTVTMNVPATRRHVLLFDPFPAGLEPLHATRVDLANQNQRYQSPWQWEETRNDGMLLYSQTVQPGVYLYHYQLRAAAPGRFIQRPTYAEEMYTPEVFGRTAGDNITVRD